MKCTVYHFKAEHITWKVLSKWVAIFYFQLQYHSRLHFKSYQKHFDKCHSLFNFSHMWKTCFPWWKLGHNTCYQVNSFITFFFLAALFLAFLLLHNIVSNTSHSTSVITHLNSMAVPAELQKTSSVFIHGKYKPF